MLGPARRVLRLHRRGDGVGLLRLVDEQHAVVADVAGADSRPCRAAPSSSTAGASGDSSVRSFSMFHSSGSFAHFASGTVAAHTATNAVSASIPGLAAASSPSLANGMRHKLRRGVNAPGQRRSPKIDHRRHQHEGHDADEEHAGAAEQAELIEPAERWSPAGCRRPRSPRPRRRGCRSATWSSPSPAPAPPACPPAAPRRSAPSKMIGELMPLPRMIEMRNAVLMLRYLMVTDAIKSDSNRPSTAGAPMIHNRPTRRK